MTQTRLKTIDAVSLKQLLDREVVTLIDVREPAEHAGEKIPNSTLISLSRFDVTNVPNNPEKTIVLYCQTGNRSARAAEKLIARSRSEIKHLDGGLLSWKAMGYPTEIDKKAPISLMRQVQIAAGSLVVIGTALGAFVSPGFLILSGFVGCGLIFAGITDTCTLGMLLARMPWNR
ncbi:rhodanese-like domain-containing protein [Oscillatoria sp. FACHB-1406]|uniref:rhodanese-like domain-containing protein n=1 Tax=Oscillatoria sp. FACHB-1406 TaxID=2692846 RepID=UPI001683D5A1|nr:rhodanese-like domain-containing protein [Oscillatoria sp. FACHB-1406]MBD2578466.1 rhodanese-like domain-containing protein [Oscillatoria sp. FACHB-1406]